MALVMMEAPRPAPDTSLHLLDDGGLLFSEESHELYVLNATAAFVWCCLEDGLEREEVAATVKRDYGGASAEAKEQIDALLLQWEKLAWKIHEEPAGADQAVEIV